MQNRRTQLNLNFLVLPVYLVLAMWLVFWVEVRWDYSLSHFGIYPATLKGLRGIVFGPFLHEQK